MGERSGPAANPLDTQAPSPPPAPVPAWARASGRAGQGDPAVFRRRRASRCSTRICAATRPPPARCAPASRCRAPQPQPRSCASAPTRRAARPALRRRLTSSVPAAKLLRLWRDLAGRPPSLDPGRLARAAARARPGSAGPERPCVQPEGLRRGGRSGLSRRQGRRLRLLRSSRTPQRPKPKSLRYGCSTSRSPSGCAGRGPLPLIATKILDPGLRSDRRRAAEAGRPSLAEGRRGRDRPRRRLRPRPRRRSCPPRRDPDRRRAQTAVETGGQNRRPPARRRLRLAQPKRRARRR